MSSQNSDSRAGLVKYASFILNQRPYFRHKLKVKLLLRAKKLNYLEAGPVIESILDDLQKSGYLNDSYLAAAFVRRQMVKGYGPRIIKIKLIQLRLDKTAISLALETEADKKAQLEAAKKYLAKKRAMDRRKSVQVLYQRGFDSQIINNLFDGDLYDV